MYVDRLARDICIDSLMHGCQNLDLGFRATQKVY